MIFSCAVDLLFCTRQKHSWSMYRLFQSSRKCWETTSRLQNGLFGLNLHKLPWVHEFYIDFCYLEKQYIAIPNLSIAQLSVLFDVKLTQFLRWWPVRICDGDAGWNGFSDILTYMGLKREWLRVRELLWLDKHLEIRKLCKAKMAEKIYKPKPKLAIDHEGWDSRQRRKFRPLFFLSFFLSLTENSLKSEKSTCQSLERDERDKSNLISFVFHFFFFYLSFFSSSLYVSLSR